MATSLQFRPQNRDLGMVMKQVDEDLAIFLGQKNDHSALGESHLQFHESKGLEPKSGSLSPRTASQEDIVPVSSVDKFLDAEIERTEHKYWLLLQPEPLVDLGVPVTKAEIPNHEAISEESKMENTNEKSRTPRNGTFHQDSLSTSTDSSSSTANKRPSSSSVSRKPSPSARLSLPAKSKPSISSAPTSRSALHTPPSKPTATRSKPHPLIVSKPGFRSSTPSCKPTSPTMVMSKKHSNTKVLNVPNKREGVMKGLVPCSPPKVQAREKMLLSRSDGCEDVNPVVMGARMVDRVVSMRKLAPPPKEDECVSSRNNFVRKSSKESSGFGRSLSKKSLEMAIRHMDIGRSISGKLLGQSE